eukprot:UC4_evm1s1095
MDMNTGETWMVEDTVPGPVSGLSQNSGLLVVQKNAGDYEVWMETNTGGIAVWNAVSETTRNIAEEFNDWKVVPG